MFDGTEIKQCFICEGYNHITRKYRNQETCFRCHGSHRQKECEKDKVEECINCVLMNRKLRLDLDENHYTMILSSLSKQTEN